jgi:hypothetical protein
MPLKNACKANATTITDAASTVTARRTPSLQFRGGQTDPSVSPFIFTTPVNVRFTRAFSNSSNGGVSHARYHSSLSRQHQQHKKEQPARVVADAADLSVQREIINRLLDHNEQGASQSPVESYTPENWFEAEQGLAWWSRQRSAESVQLTFQLLDRLIQERTIQARSETASSFMFSDSWLLDTKLLHRLLRNWQIVWSIVQQEGQREEEKSQIISDNFTIKDMCDRLEGYANSGIVHPDESCFYTVLQAAVRQGDTSQRPDVAEYILQRIQQCHENNAQQKQEQQGLTLTTTTTASTKNNKGKGGEPDSATLLQPTTEFFNLVIRAWSESGRPEAPARARAVMDQMLESHVRPDALTYHGVLYAWAAAGKPYEAEALLRRMYSEYLQGDDKVRPELPTFTTVIFAWAKSGRPEAAERAEQILDAMKQVGSRYRRERERDYRGPPREAVEADTPCMNAVLSCYAATKTRSSAQRADQILQEMKRSGPWADIDSYMMVIKAWASVANGERAEALLDEAYEIYMRGNRKMMPTTDICTTVIAAWAQSPATNKVERAQAVLSKMNDWNEKSSEMNLRPGIESYNALLHTIANSKHNHSDRGASPAAQADRLLQQIKAKNREDPSNVQPNRNSYTTVIQAWSKVGGVDRAEKAFRDMLADHEDGNEGAKPDRRAFNSVLSTFANSDIPQAPEKSCEFLAQMQSLGENDASIQPDVYSYSSVLACLARNVARRKKESKRIALAERAESILADMQTRFEAGDEKVRPNTVVWNCVLNAWALAGLPARAEALFQRMYQDFVDGNTSAKPSRDTFNTLIKAWAFAKHAESPQKAVEILERMEELQMSGALNVFPDVVSFTTAMLCLSFRSKQRGAPQRAEELLRRMEALHETGRLKEGPNKKSYQVLRKTWQMSKEPFKKERVAAIEREMEERFGPVQQPPTARSKNGSID